MSEGVIAPALVYCNCTKPKTGNDADEANFEIYQYLTVDPNGDRSIFCTDYPFIYEDDCKPYINITPFPYCQSEFYVEAVKNLEEYASKRYMEAVDQRNMEEYVKWGKWEADFHNAYLSAIQQKKLSKKQYTCLLQVLDRWFNTEEETVNQYFNWSQEIRKRMGLIEETFHQIIRKVRKKLEDNQPDFIEKTLERFRRAYEAIAPNFDNIIINESSGSFYFDLEKIKRKWNSAWNKETDNPLLSFDKAAENMLKIIELLSDMICDELFFTDNQELVSKNMGTVREILQSFYESLSGLDYDAPDFNTMLKQFGICLARLELEVGFRDRGKKFAGKNSFLVCRCGGIIHIVYDGQDMKRHLFYLYPNIINILKSAEAYFYEKYHEYKTDGRVKFSMMDGYNFVRFILIALKEESQHEEFLGVKYKDIELFGAFGVEMDILIRPRSVMNKDENIKTAIANIMKFCLGKMDISGIPATHISNIVAIADDPSVTNITAETSAIASNFGKNLVKAVGEAAGYIFDLKDIAGIAQNLSYTSVADYVGEVQISFSLGTHDIIYRRKYNIWGEQEEESFSSDMREKAGMDFDTQAQRETPPEIKFFDNIIKVDCMLIKDGEKIQEKKEYFIDDENDGGIQENKN